MSLHKRSLLSRLYAVEKIIRPKASIKAKIAALSPEDKASYDAWKEKCTSWHAARPGEKAYIAFLEGESPPEMPARIARKIEKQLEETGDAALDYQMLVESTQMLLPRRRSKRA